ncbi:MAG: VWA domain-containing protein [Deltaproteobacteria bacterium]|nr:VWA domain-containing protein [Deltaproteobacteria bacterium]
MKAPSYSIAAGHPIVLAIGLLVALVVAFRLLRTDLALSRSRRIASSLLAWLALLCAVLAAAEVELVRPADRMTVVVAADRSRSIDLVPEAERSLVEQLLSSEQKMLRDDRLGLVRFGASAALAQPLHAKGEGQPIVEPTIGRDATDLEAGIRRAVDEVLAGGGGRVLVVSDGVANRGDALAAAARARALGVPVDVVVWNQQVLPDVRVVAARGPTLADEGETIEVRAVVHTPPRPNAAAGRTVDVEVKVSRDGVHVKTFLTKVASGEDVIRFKDKPPEPGLHRYDVHVRPLDATIDASAEDNEATTFVRVRGPSTVLVLQKDESRAGPLRSALEAEGYRVVVRGRFGVPTELAELAAFDLVVLADIPAKDLIPSQMDALAKYVKDFGGGLLLLGSDSSMGPGGYARTPIEEISPVTFDLTKERRRSALTELIVIDYSGSMAARVEGNIMKIDLANEAAARAAALLGPGDKLGVWHVDTSVRETIPLGPVPPDAGKKIRSVGPGGGGIFIDLSLREGYKVLSREKENLRHMLLFSDGADAEERYDAPNLVKKATSMGITTSVIALGDGPDVPALEQMAKLGGGRFYLITDARKLPAVFAQETILAARSSIKEEEFVPHVRTSSPAIKGLPFNTAPPLRGYVVTQPKPRAQLVLDGVEGDPVLSLWPIGLGHVGAWTSDFTDQWAGGFIKWPGAAQLIVQLARELGRKSDEARVRLDATAKDGVLHVTAEPSGLSGASGLLHLRAHVEGPDGIARDVELLPGPGGTYVTDLPISAPGAYVVRATDVGDSGQGTQSAGLAAALLSRADELRPTGSDRRALERIAELTGGTVDGSLADVFTRRTGLRPTTLPLAPWLLPLALALMLLGVASRRLGVPRPIERAFAWVWSAPSRLVAARAESKTARAEKQITVTDAKVVQVALPKAQPRLDVDLAAQGPIATRPAEPARQAAGLAAAIAQKRREEKAHKQNAAPVIVKAERPARPAEPKAEAGASSLADLARKRREKKDGS